MEAPTRPSETFLLRFAVSGRLELLEPFGGGHINATFRSTFRTSRGPERYLHQRINDRVFLRPDHVQENIRRVLDHLSVRNPGSPVLSLIPSRDGGLWVRSDDGGWWRTYRFVEGSVSREIFTDDGQARNAARTLARFQRSLADLPLPRLHETIPGFHDAPGRFWAFREAVAADRSGRAGSVGPEIEWLADQEDRASVVTRELASGRLPERVTHNDAKPGNILLDENTGEALCLVDLDTVMPGSPLHDFGDLVRAGTASVPEDHPVPGEMQFLASRFEALVRGYAEEAGDFLTSREKELWPEAGRSVTIVQALRFLTDHLNGDTYYGASRPGQNLDRTRTQIALVRSMDNHEERLAEVCRRWLG